MIKGIFGKMTPDLENLNYFELMAHLGACNIHPGGFKTTKLLINLANLNKRKYILDVGCGTGNTSLYLAKKYNADVIGIDASNEMIKKAKERAKKQNLNICFKVANVCNLPFEDNSFDALIGESINIYVDKQNALKEYKRVVKNKGIISATEFTWLKNPSQEAINDMSDLLGVQAKILNQKEWESIFDLEDFSFQVFKLNMNRKYLLRKILDQRLNVKLLLKIAFNPEIRTKVKKVKSHFEKYSDYFGYGVYMGKNNKNLT